MWARVARYVHAGRGGYTRSTIIRMRGLMDIHLTDFEIALFDSIAFPPDDAMLAGERADNNSELAHLLAVSLFERNAVPAHRIRFFEDAEHNVGRSCSVRESLEHAGAEGDAVYARPEFLKYLRYFICGPELPEKVERVFRRELVERGGGSQRRLVAKVRELARTLGASDEQREKFYQQALEFGLHALSAREIANAALAPE